MTWEKEADVVVVGYGGAGASAAIAAHDAGAKVIVVEKTSHGGGNTQYAGGSLRTFVDKAKVVEHYYQLCEGMTDREVLMAFVEEASRNTEWLQPCLQQTGFELVFESRGQVEGFPRTYDGSPFPTIPGAEGLGMRVHVAKGGSAEKGGVVEFGGVNLWGVLQRAVGTRGVEVLFNHEAQHLITANGGEVAGVEARGPGGVVRVKARRGVVLCCGGFENNPEMHLNYLSMRYVYPKGTEANTGDGINMAMEVGADLWHMNAIVLGFGYKVEGYEVAFAHRVRSGGFIYVDQHGKRFMDETGVDTHAMWSQVSYFDIKTAKMPRVPAYFVFDDDTRRSGPVSDRGKGQAVDLYRWSDDNLAEVERGWISRGETVAELAEKVGIDGKQLQETVSRYNLACVGGYDLDFGRSPGTLVPVARPPFYAIALWPAFTNTQGGPRRNARAQVVHVSGNPINRLYSAGELGSIWGRLYPGAGNVSEALAFGRIAGRNAAAESPWE